MENNSHYDVVIVGAGPAGLRCAEILGRAGKKVLLLEKNPVIGPKVCAGGLTRKGVKFLDLPPELVEKIFENIVFESPAARTKLEFGEPFSWTIDRKRLGQWQLKKLTGTSVEVRTNTKVTEISRQEVVVNGKERIEFDFLVGADGSNSLVRKFLKIPVHLFGVAFQYMIPIPFENFEIHLNTKFFGPWYAWIFPHQEKTSVGYGCFPKIMTMEKAKNNFFKWAAEKGIDVSKGELQAHPLNCDYRGYKFGNIFLVGDAAGFVSGLTGEGIYQALVSGEEVAKIIIDPKHRPSKIREIRREIMLHNFILAIVYLAGPLRNPLYNLVTRCVRNKFLARTLMRALT